MDKNEVVGMLIKILKENQKDIGEDVGDIDEKTRPIGDLVKFDSLMSVAVTVTCCKIFGISEDKNIQSLFVGENDKGFPFARSVGQVADAVLTLNH